MVLEGESILITSEDVGAEKYRENADGPELKGTFAANKKHCKQLTIACLYLNASISTLNCPNTHTTGTEGYVVR